MGNGPRIDCSNDVPLTQQSAKDECDINLIVEAAKRGADLSQRLSGRTPMYGDFTGLPDYREALLMVTKAREMFMGLDAFVRERFGNDPARLLDFLADDRNRDEAVKLGLVEPPPVADPPLDASEPAAQATEPAANPPAVAPAVAPKAFKSPFKGAR